MKNPIYIKDDSLVILGENLTLTALVTTNGKVKWSQNTNETLHSDYFLQSRNIVYGRTSHSLVGWNITTGTTNWNFAIPDSIGGYPFSGDAINQDTVYVALADYILQVSLDTGMEQMYPVRGGANTLQYRNGQLYYLNNWGEWKADGVYDIGTITCLASHTGDTLWSFMPEGVPPSYTAPILLDETTLYFGTVSLSGKTTDLFRTYALDADDGSLVWKTNKEVFTYHHILIGDTIYGNDGLGLYALDKHTGELLWQTDLEVGHGERPVAYLDGYLYHAKGGALHVVDAQTGEIVISRMLGPDKSSVRVASAGAGAVFVQTNQHLYCYEPYQPGEE
ncbi:MAG: PQQ-binding-like beta-propeller repeat protein [Candidatus Marinimicrobia bacterium]|nr:PQQ-binding-like beta-propeller repeat protein [Candidatus Neomarinimicrobiota bacterium]MCF7829926.1 PQQ-binding-like beta-propeller repeat protein [Candidatus Neomarinimicrobiota bacterium]MCF7879111.1 PQQ-binding-like beta-propeller repeat protein [Candidatus Neomarinimicrobiota bacterium]